MALKCQETRAPPRDYTNSQSLYFPIDKIPCRRRQFKKKFHLVENIDHLGDLKSHCFIHGFAFDVISTEARSQMFADNARACMLACSWVNTRVNFTSIIKLLISKNYYCHDGYRKYWSCLLMLSVRCDIIHVSSGDFLCEYSFIQR